VEVTGGAVFTPTLYTLQVEMVRVVGVVEVGITLLKLQLEWGYLEGMEVSQLQQQLLGRVLVGVIKSLGVLF
jgi:hypothetical protein